MVCFPLFYPYSCSSNRRLFLYLLSLGVRRRPGGLSPCSIRAAARDAEDTAKCDSSASRHYDDVCLDWRRISVFDKLLRFLIRRLH
jgi:hypothetical protein